MKTKNIYNKICKLIVHGLIRANNYCSTVPPRWIIEPSNVANVQRNRHLVLNCQAQGVPTPTVVWKKALGKEPKVCPLRLFCRNLI